jgi:hypothetical protein
MIDCHVIHYRIGWIEHRVFVEFKIALDLQHFILVPTETIQSILKIDQINHLQTLIILFQN